MNTITTKIVVLWQFVVSTNPFMFVFARNRFDVRTIVIQKTIFTLNSTRVEERVVEDSLVAATEFYPQKKSKTVGEISLNWQPYRIIDFFQNVFVRIERYDVFKWTLRWKRGFLAYDVTEGTGFGETLWTFW